MLPELAVDTCRIAKKPEPDGPTVRLYSRNAYDWTARLAGIAAVAQGIKARSFAIDGEAVVLGPDGLSRFEECPAVRQPEPRYSTPST
jgi:ATP-dependent DNA ligase